MNYKDRVLKNKVPIIHCQKKSLEKGNLHYFQMIRIELPIIHNAN